MSPRLWLRILGIVRRARPREQGGHPGNAPSSVLAIALEGVTGEYPPRPVNLGEQGRGYGQFCLCFVTHAGDRGLGEHASRGLAVAREYVDRCGMGRDKREPSSPSLCRPLPPPVCRVVRVQRRQSR